MAKTRKVEETKGEESLLPGLPDHVAQLCLRRLKPSILYSVSRSWRRLLYSPSFPPHLSLYALMSLTCDDSRPVQFFNLDPISSQWRVLPDPPIRLLLRHPSFISRTLPIQSVSVSGRLVLLAATTSSLSPALPSPLVFDPAAETWRSGPEMVHKRRWCAAGACGGYVYVASGMGAQYSPGVARSAERWEGKWGSGWERIGGLRDGRFSREAIEGVGWRGKVWMVNVKGRAAKEGAAYDVGRGEWEEMPPGMMAGWRGPVAAMDEADMYVVDEEDGALRRFHPDREEWDTLAESHTLRGAEQVAAGGGRVCVVANGGGIVVVDVVADPPRLWEVETPPGWQALALHILPRMTQTTFTSTSH